MARDYITYRRSSFRLDGRGVNQPAVRSTFMQSLVFVFCGDSTGQCRWPRQHNPVSARGVVITRETPITLPYADGCVLLREGLA
jgi:hypothetical protein